MKALALVSVLLLAIPAPRVFADDLGASCKVVTDAIAADANRIKDKYKPQLDALKKYADDGAQKVKSEEPDPSAAGTAIGFDIKVSSHDQEFIFGLPSATMKTQSIIWDAPVITTHRVSWSWSVPETTMKTQCTQGIPETVCTPVTCSLPNCSLSGCSGGGCWGGQCSIRAGQQICTDIPQITMVQHDASMDAPDVKVVRNEIKMDIPEFSMQQQRIVLTIPDFTLVNVSVQNQQVQKDSQDLQASTQVQADSISKSMKSDMISTESKDVSNAFDCYASALLTQRDNSLAQLDAQIKQMQQQSAQARSQSNPTLADAIDAGIKQVLASRQQVVDQFASALNTLHAQRDKTLANLLAKQ